MNKILLLKLLGPMDGATVTESPVTVRGKVSNAKLVTVNDVKVRPFGRDNVFKTEVKLTEGENIIKVVATRGEKVVTKTITITYSPEE